MRIRRRTRALGKMFLKTAQSGFSPVLSIDLSQYVTNHATLATSYNHKCIDTQRGINMYYLCVSLRSTLSCAREPRWYIIIYICKDTIYGTHGMIPYWVQIPTQSSHPPRTRPTRHEGREGVPYMFMCPHIVHSCRRYEFTLLIYKHDPYRLAVGSI